MELRTENNSEVDGLSTDSRVYEIAMTLKDSTK